MRFSLARGAPQRTRCTTCKAAQGRRLGAGGVGPVFWQNDWPAAIKMALQREGGKVLHVQLPNTGERLLMVVAAASLTGNYRNRSTFFHKVPCKPWALRDWEAQAALLLREMALRHGLPFNLEPRTSDLSPPTLSRLSAGVLRAGLILTMSTLVVALASNTASRSSTLTFRSSAPDYNACWKAF